MKNIFKVKPEQWGFRGDEPFWDELENRFDDTKITTKEELVAFIKATHRELTGEDLTEDSSSYCESLASGFGHSDGIISGSWWYQKGIPLLTKRI